MNQDPWVAKADAERVDLQRNLLPLYGLGWVGGALALMIGGIVLAVVKLDGAFPVVAVIFSIAVALFTSARAITARGPLRQFADAADTDFSGAPAESIRHVPAALLQPADALDIQHLDRIASADTTHLPHDRIRRSLADAISATNGVAGIGWLVRGIAVGAAAAITVNRGVVWEYLAPLLLVVVGSLAAAAIAVPASHAARMNRIFWAERVIRTRAVLARGDLPDDGSYLSFLARGDEGITLELKRIARRARPRPRDFADFHAGHFTREPLAAWIIAVLALVGGATSALLAVLAN